MLFPLGCYRVLSTTTHPIIILSDSDVEEAFTYTNTPDYTPASPDYSLASPGNTSFDPSEDSSKDCSASLTISPFHDDPYMKVMQAYNATNNESPIPLPQAPITPPLIEGLGNGRVIIQRYFDQLETKLQEARTQIAGFLRKQMGHDNEIVLARIRIATLEMLIEDIQIRHQSDMKSLLFMYVVVVYPISCIVITHVSGITMVLLPFGFLEPLCPGIMNMINNKDIEHMIPPTPPRDTESPVGSPIPSSPSSSVGSSSPVRSTTPPPDYPFDESIFAKLDNSLWIIPRPLKSKPVPEEPNESHSY
ncbi:hypothetical protein Tco_0825502 [Tanacetum coccineum]